MAAIVVRHRPKQEAGGRRNVPINAVDCDGSFNCDVSWYGLNTTALQPQLRFLECL